MITTQHNDTNQHNDTRHTRLRVTCGICGAHVAHHRTHTVTRVFPTQRNVTRHNVNVVCCARCWLRVRHIGVYDTTHGDNVWQSQPAYDTDNNARPYNVPHTHDTVHTIVVPSSLVGWLELYATRHGIVIDTRR